MTPDPGPKVESIQTVSGREQIRDQDKIHLFLSYFGIFSLIPLLTVKDSPFVQWHAKQGLSVVVASIGLAIAGAILAFIPILHFVTTCAVGLAQMALWVMDIIAMVKAFGGERWEIPGIASLAKKF